eukprot:scaffold2273_cov178-Chaetoceros_neogracile.AAC.2
MISLEDVFEFYSNSSSFRASLEPSNLTWKEILECLQHSDAGDFAYATIGSDKKTLLHYHFSSSNITGEDNDAIAVARILIERSIDMCESTVQEHGDSVLTVSDRCGRTPLHDLLRHASFRQHLHIRYVELIIEMSARVDEKRKTSFYWNELMLQQNRWGCTPLHMMAENPPIGYLVVSLVLKKCNDTWESRCLIHPLLQSDNHGNLPIHSACYEADTSGQWIEAFVGFLDSDYKVTYDTVFTYECLCQILESFIDDHHEEFKQFWNDNNWWSSEERGRVSLQQILSSDDNERLDDIDWSSLRTPFDDLLPKLRVLLIAAAKSNMYHTHQTQEYEISLESVHLASSVPNVPTCILQMMVLHDQSALLRTDEHGRIPLHYALVATPGNQEQYSREDSFRLNLAYWSANDESRSLVQFILDNAPRGAEIHDVDGRLPIHLAIANNRDLSSVVLPIIAAYPGSISAIDPCTNLKPFLLAASHDNASLDLIFRLAVLEPNLINA